jgi:hypothetical protein
MGTTVSWQWYVLIGSAVTFIVGNAASMAFERSRVAEQAVD